MAINTLASKETNLFKIVTAVNQLAQGRTNAAGQVTLAATGTETLVSGLTIGPDTKPVLFPANAAAAAEMASGACYVTAVQGGPTGGSFKIIHQNGVAGRVFNWTSFG